MKIIIQRYAVRIFMIVIFITIFGGCTRNISLQYYPTTTLQAKSQRNIAIVKFADIRPKPAMGEVHGSFCIITFTLRVKNQDVGAWVANALSDELRFIGYDIKKFNDIAPVDADVAISGTVPEAYIKQLFCIERCVIRAKVSLTKANVVVLNREYISRVRRWAWLGTTSGYEELFKKTLQDLMKQLAPDIVKAID